MTKAEAEKHSLEKLSLKDAYERQLDDYKRALEWHVQRYENAHLKLYQALADKEAWRNMSDYWEVKFKKQAQGQIENGFRRAQHDPNYAVIRELLHNNQDLDKVDLIELAKNNPSATIFGLVQICEELGKRLKTQLVPRENKP